MWLIECEADGTVTRTEVPDEPDARADALAEAHGDVEAAETFAELKAATAAYLTLITPGATP